MTLLILIVFLGAATLAMPIAHAILLAAMAAAVSSDRVPFDLLVQQMVAQVQSFPLIAIPFFMLTGSLMMGGKLGQAIVGTLTVLVGRCVRFSGGRCIGHWILGHALAPQAGLSHAFFGGLAGVGGHHRHHHPTVDPHDFVCNECERVDRGLVLRRYLAWPDLMRRIHGGLLVCGQA
jgi:hypothetical protein